ncbi:MAG TPA: inorganic diphosphatase, partial [Wenzhouxiangella sp.]
SQVKYEIDPSHGGLVVDRFLPDDHRYPAHYGGLPSVYASDGDLLDVMVISKHRLQPGALIEVRPIGLARMLDGGERDDKILAIPLTQFEGVPEGSSISDWLGRDMTQAIASFFKGYKHAENKDNPIKWQGYGSSSEAKQVIQQAMTKMPQANQPQTHLPPAHLRQTQSPPSRPVVD